MATCEYITTIEVAVSFDAAECKIFMDQMQDIKGLKFTILHNGVNFNVDDAKSLQELSKFELRYSTIATEKEALNLFNIVFWGLMTYRRNK
jgi:hypothetical protein